MHTDHVNRQRRRLEMLRHFDERPSRAAVDQVAERIGVKGSTLFRWEQGVRKPHAVLVEKWDEVLDELEREAGFKGKERRRGKRGPA